MARIQSGAPGPAFSAGPKISGGAEPPRGPSGPSAQMSAPSAPAKTAERSIDLGDFDAPIAAPAAPARQPQKPGPGVRQKDTLQGVKPGEFDANTLRKKPEADDKPADSVDAVDPETVVEDKPVESLEIDLGDEPSEPEGGAGAEPQKKQRDYSVFKDDAARDIARKLNNAELDKFRAYYQDVENIRSENTRLKTESETAPKTPLYHYESENGYTLDPKWGQLNEAYAAVSDEATHWQNQLYKIAAGEDWQNFRGLDNRGQPVYELVKAPANGAIDGRAQIDVQRALASADARQQSLMSQANGFVADFKGRVQQAKDHTAQIKAKLFPTLSSKPFEGDDKKAFTQAADMLPGIFKSHPLYEISQLQHVMMMRMLRRYKSVETENKRLVAASKGRELSQNRRIPAGGQAVGTDEPGDRNISLTFDDE